jgi:diaminohydroxyphosphoribosylaminopyrimidine deaminase/5-amino-6-(5-phosphoribosylamino)uracil reductase
MRTGLPLVRLKLAVSLDGRTAMASGESQWITGPAARSDVQRLRARSSAIVTGVGTVLADDPALTVRTAEMGDLGQALEPSHQPLRVVLDSMLRTGPRARVIGRDGRCVVVTGKQGLAGQNRVGQLMAAGARVQGLDADKRPDIHALLKWLATESCNEVLVESGPILAGAFLSLGLVDEFWLYQAPTLLGSDARPMAVMPFERMAQQLRLHPLDQRRVGSDLRTIFVPERSQPRGGAG